MPALNPSSQRSHRRKMVSKSFVNQGGLFESQNKLAAGPKSKKDSRRMSDRSDDCLPMALTKSQSLIKLGGKKNNKKNLPTGFAENVISQEFEIEQGGIELIELIQLYQSAVEYYDSIGDVKNSQIY